MIENQTLDVSIVIPAFNEEKYIKKCLESISRLETKLNYEIILVDNNCTDQTVNIAQSFQDKLNIKIVKESKQSRGAARARGFKEARANIILSTDADTFVYTDWVDTLVGGIKGEVVASTTSSKITDGSFLTNLLFNLIQPAMTSVYGTIFGYSWLFGFSFAISKSVYERVGGFNVNLQAQEDFDLGYKVSKLGKIKFINKPVIFSARRFKEGFLKGLLEYVWTFFQAFILKKKDIYLGNPR